MRLAGNVLHAIRVQQTSDITAILGLHGEFGEGLATCFGSIPPPSGFSICQRWFEVAAPGSKGCLALRDEQSVRA